MELFKTGETIKPDFSEKRWITGNVTIDDFKKHFISSVNAIMKRSGDKFEFMIDDNNREFINQMFYYLNGHKEFNGDPNKGIFLLGDIGSGKTFLMMVLFDMIENLMRKIVTQIPAKRIHTEIEEKGLEYFRNRPLFIDDIGKEEKEIKVYGSIHKPFEELISFRYANKAVTFGTGNYNMQTYENMYQRYLTDRMKQLFNIVVLKGKSRR